MAKLGVQIVHRAAPLRHDFDLNGWDARIKCLARIGIFSTAIERTMPPGQRLTIHQIRGRLAKLRKEGISVRGWQTARSLEAIHALQKIDAALIEARNMKKDISELLTRRSSGKRRI
jgi:hypothetical protein